MATDYDAFYGDNPRGLGEPTGEFVRFFDEYNKACAEVLDVGCGQGRDALFIARQGHRVTAVDQSPNGISDLLDDAAAEGLMIDALVGDARTFDWQGPYDVIVIDRTLHMLVVSDRLAVLDGLIGQTRAGSHVLIADERRNLPEMADRFERSEADWTPTLAKKGFLFLARSR